MDEPGAWEVTVLLADAAQVADGKLYVLGGGWSLSGPGPFIHALAIKIAVPWDQTNQRHHLTATLRTEDGADLRLGEPAGGVSFESEFEVGRPVGLPAGSSLDVPLAVNVGPLRLPPGSGFHWDITIDGTQVARVPFRTRPAT